MYIDLRIIFDNKRIYDLIVLVDSYDTWKWQNEIDDTPLYVNEYFLRFKTLTEFYTKIFLTNIEISSIKSVGKKISQIKKDICKNIKHSIVTINQQKFIIINDKASIYHIDNVLNKVNFDNRRLILENENYSQTMAIIFYQSIDFVNNKINLSVRQIYDNFDCSNFVKIISNNNGGGHSAAAGCQLSINEFINLIEK